MRKVLLLLLALALSACASNAQHNGVLPTTTGERRGDAATAVAGLSSVNWMVGTGASTYSYSLQDLDYYPNDITIDAGDTITYSVASGAGGDAHTVSFVPSGQTIPSPEDPNDVVPVGGNVIDGTKFVNSGILFGGQTFTLHFPKAGVYRILCLFHEPAMESTVTVQRAGAPYPHTQAFYNSAGAADRWSDLMAAQRSIALFPFANGGTTIAAGIAPGLTGNTPPTQSTVLRFINSNNTASFVIAREGSFTIKAGTVLRFVNETNNEPHTVTLAPLSVLATLPPIPMNAVFPPAVNTYDGSKVINSGALLKGQSFLIKFTKPGSYFYGCVFHFNSRMTGTITVTP